jgi:hypothetical protein
MTCNLEVKGSTPLDGFFNGEVSEWFKEAVLKTVEGVNLPEVQILSSP